MKQEHHIRYDSIDMKSGIDTALLVLFAPVTKAMFMLDPRGAYFRNKDVQIAVETRALPHKKECEMVAMKEDWGGFENYFLIAAFRNPC